VIAANASDVNPYSLQNTVLIQEEKARVEYKNGVTLPTSVRVLLANAANKGCNHRRTLSRNIVAATSKRPAWLSVRTILLRSAIRKQGRPVRCCSAGG
jgi:hypothetical protein